MFHGHISSLKIFQEYYQSYNLDPDQGPHFVRPDLGQLPVCKVHQQMKKALSLAAIEFKNLFVALFHVGQVQLIILCIVCDDYLIRFLRVSENS